MPSYLEPWKVLSAAIALATVTDETSLVVALNFLCADFPGMISWKKLNRGNLLRIPDLNVQSKLSSGYNGLLRGQWMLGDDAGCTAADRST